MPLSAQPMLPPAQEGGPSAVATYSTWIYGGPGAAYVIYGAFLGGNTAQVAGKSEDGAWWAISVPAAPGSVGWVDGAWVVVSGVEAVPVLPTPPVPPTADLVPPGPNDPQATARVNANVRSGPAETYPAYGVAPAGAVGRVIGRSEDGAWWAVRIDPALVGAGYGWVAESTVQAENTEDVAIIAAPPAPEIAEPIAPPEDAPTATAVDYVNVRSGPGSCYVPYLIAPPGASGEITGVTEDGAWWQLRLPTEVAGTGVGWVSADYVTTTNTDGMPVVAGEPCDDADVPAPEPLECVLVAQSPLDYTVQAAGADFAMEWTVVNTGSDAWTQSVAQFVRAGQTGELHTDEDGFALDDDVQPGEGVTVKAPAAAPDVAGTYGELWEINAGAAVVCQFWMIINVR
jgi:uncharacterized protein YraI